MQITIDRQIVNHILRYVQQDADHERCGLVSVDGSGHYKLYTVKNIADDPASHFEMDPQGLISAMKEIREDDAELFAIFHSHPQAEAEPSNEDIDKIGYPDALYMIISLNTKGVLELRAYKKNNFSMEPVALQL